MTELDYGTLLCWGRNELGMQKAPCVFHVIPAGMFAVIPGCQSFVHIPLTVCTYLLHAILTDRVFHNLTCYYM